MTRHRCSDCGCASREARCWVCEAIAVRWFVLDLLAKVAK
jgi:hypothetical protein